MNQKRKFKETEIGRIPDDWEEKPIGDVCKLVKEQFIPNENDVRPYIGLEHIDQGTLHLASIGKSSDVKSNKFIFRKGQILFGKLRPYFRKVIRPSFDGVCSTDIWVIQSKNGHDNDFLFYFFANPEIIDEASRSSEGTKMPRAVWNYLSILKRHFPLLEEQKKIAGILGALDDKIELNHKMNMTLERIGQAIFKHWFIDFEFPNEKGKPYKSSGGKIVDSELGEIPEGWDVKKVGDVIDIFGGTTPSTKEPKYWEGGSIHWATPKDLSELDSPVLIDTERKITPEGLATISSGLLPAGTVLLSSRAPIGYTAISQIPISINQGFIAMVCNRELPKYYMLCWVQYSIDIIKSVASGTTFEEVNKSNFRRLNILVPPSGLLSTFSTILGSIYEHILNNSYQCRTLICLRDSLLPRLMSGKIRVGVGK